MNSHLQHQKCINKRKNQMKKINENGMAIRYAGDEFIVLLPGVDAECVSTTMEEIAENLSRFYERLTVITGRKKICYFIAVCGEIIARPG